MITSKYIVLYVTVLMTLQYDVVRKLTQLHNSDFRDYV